MKSLNTTTESLPRAGRLNITTAITPMRPLARAKSMYDPKKTVRASTPLAQPNHIIFQRLIALAHAAKFATCDVHSAGLSFPCFW
jgi:hypothetical protein